jgi:hypothetical protein
MMVGAASDARRAKGGGQAACKPRANYLKSKEISGAPRHFDLRQATNYLKVKMNHRA